MKQKLKTSVIGSYPVCVDTLELINDYFSEQESSWARYIK